MSFGKLKGKCKASVADNRLFADGFSVIESLCRYIAGAGSLTDNGKSAVVSVGIEFCKFNAVLGDKFEPYGLPDTGCTGVVAAVRSVQS